MLTLAEADAEMQRLAVLRKNHADEQYVARRSVRDLPATIDRLASALAGLAADMATAAAHADDPITIGSRPCDREDAIDLLGHRLEIPARQGARDQPRPAGPLSRPGLRHRAAPDRRPEAYLEGLVTRHAMLSRDSHGPRAILNALDRLIGSYAANPPPPRQDLAIARASSATTRPASASPSPTRPIWPS